MRASRGYRGHVSLTAGHSTRWDSPRLRALVVIPTYNERENIQEVVARLLDVADLDVLFVDDGSPDGTAQAIETAASADCRIHLLTRPSKQGLGTAYVDGFRWGLERGYGALVEMDADLSHNPEDIPRLLEALGDADLVIGSRYVEGGGVRNWVWWRRALSFVANWMVRVLLGYPIHDSTAGFQHSVQTSPPIDFITLEVAWLRLSG